MQPYSDLKMILRRFVNNKSSLTAGGYIGSDISIKSLKRKT